MYIYSAYEKNIFLIDMPRRFLRICSDEVCKYICCIFNLCIEQGIFPNTYKNEKVTPVHKKVQTNTFVNYRPIAILCNLSRIFESIIYNRLQEFFVSQGLLSEKQFGIWVSKRQRHRASCFRYDL